MRDGRALVVALLLMAPLFTCITAARLPCVPFGYTSNPTYYLIYCSNWGLTAITPVPADRRNYTETMELPRNAITFTPQDAAIMRGLPILKVLDLSYNRVTSIQPNSFQDLTLMFQLLMTNNLITELPAGTFDKLTLLQDVRFTNNRIASLPPRIFANNDALKILKLDGNAIQHLPVNMFPQSPPRLWEVTFKENWISSLDFGLFSGLASVGKLDLSNNHIRTIPHNVFNGLGSSCTVYLTGNPLIHDHRLCSAFTYPGRHYTFSVDPVIQANFRGMAITNKCNWPCNKWRPEPPNVRNCPNAFCNGTVGNPTCLPLAFNPSIGVYYCNATRTVLTMHSSKEGYFSDAVSTCRAFQATPPDNAQFANGCVQAFAQQIKTKLGIAYTPVVWLNLHDRAANTIYASNRYTYVPGTKYLYIMCAREVAK
ncbi:uncharacterized protein LOC135821125 [Sycon ciliatum]|uniref:uncharacterized protein LOC135821125 n=1 Tax=Sycon ciliatum TaxID=27933 RepID=UPI0020A9DC12|eukprot:scpid67376/ scgid16495/ Leucine-rich repeat-containing protein 15